MKLFSFLTVLFTVAIVFLTAESGSAYIVSVHVEGIVTGIETGGGLELDDSVIVGSTIVTGYCTYDTETPDQYPGSSSTGLYSMLSISMSAGSYTFTHDPAAGEEPYVYIDLEPSGAFYYDIRSSSPIFYGPAYLNGQATTLEDLDLSVRGILWTLAADDYDGTITDALPNENTFPDLSVFTQQYVWVSNDSSPWVSIWSDITSLTVVPEPASAIILGLGAVAVILRRKRR